MRVGRVLIGSAQPTRVISADLLRAPSVHHCTSTDFANTVRFDYTLSAEAAPTQIPEALNDDPK